MQERTSFPAFLRLRAFGFGCHWGRSSYRLKESTEKGRFCQDSRSTRGARNTLSLAEDGVLVEGNQLFARVSVVV
jgi:hypothetical protein